MKNDYVYDDDRQDLQEQFDWMIVELFYLPEADKHAESLRRIDEYWTENRHRDRDGWLRRAVHCERANVFHDAGQFEDALREWQALHRFGQRIVWEEVHLDTFWALTLLRLDRPRQALERLEHALSVIPEQVPSAPLNVFHYMALAYRELGQSLPDHHLPRFIAAVDAKGRDIQEDLHAHPELLQQAAIHAYTSTTRAALDRRRAAAADAADDATET